MKETIYVKWLVLWLFLMASAVTGILLLNDTESAGGTARAITEKLPEKSRLTERAVLALAEGFSLKDSGAGSINALRDLCTSPEESALVRLFASGREADALKAIRGLAAIGGNANRLLSAVMNDSGWPEKVRSEAALALLEGGSESQAKAAIQGLALIGGDKNTQQLAAILNDTSLSEPLRLEAALDLGRVGSPLACDALIAAFEQFSDPDIHAQLLDSLGRFPFPQIEETWKQFLNAPDTPDELRVAAVDALSNSTPEALPYLQSLTASDRDPEVREMAAWAISILGVDGPLGPQLRDMALVEPEPDVRRRLYEAMMKQETNPATTLLPLIREESDTAARVAGLNAVADSLRRSGQPAAASEFDQRFVQELTNLALSDNSLNIRMRSVFALRRAGTPGAQQALATLSQSTTPQIAQAARNGLQAASK